MTAVPGKQIGSRYELEREIGRGATSVVWRARLKGSSERVAVKVLRPEIATDPQLVSRFAAERTLLMSVDHPNLVRLRDMVADGALLALVFEWVDARSLRERLLGDPLPVPEAVTIAAGLARALAFLHAAKVVHCDVKPANVLLADEDRVLLADLGLAWLVGDQLAASHHTLAGTPGYLAPEVSLGVPPAPSADIYALGVVLYEMLTGRSAHETDREERRTGSRLQVLASVVEDNASSAEGTKRLARIPDVPRALWRIVWQLPPLGSRAASNR